MDGVEMEEVNKFKYLGIFMSANLEMGKEEKTRRKVWGSLGSP